MNRSTFTQLAGVAAGAACFPRPAAAAGLTTIRFGTAPPPLSEVIWTSSPLALK
jgi:hypothetical protein